MSNLIAFSIPFFLLLIGVELLLARRGGRRVYRLPDALSDLGCGVGQQVVLVLANAWLLGLEVRLFESHRWLTLEQPWLQWLVALVGVDFAYYWWHRLSHRVSILWAVHVVHHQSEDYNLAVALRQAVFSAFTMVPFFVPLLLLGVPPLVLAAANGIDTVYQFWIHTELVGRLGPLEHVLNTPSHHRVHHAVNARYLDKNYGGILIVWDKLFGTFVAETERPIYGTTRPFGSFNAAWAQLAYYPELVRRARMLPRLVDKLKLPWMPPDWAPAHALEAPVTERAKVESPARPSSRLYALVQFAPLVPATFLLLLEGAALSPALLLACIALVFLTLASLGGILDARRWGWPLEAGRLGAMAVGAALWASGLLPPPGLG
ncbi:MAG: sterol desaturase family protein [Myxococcales bacterium]